MEPVDESNGSSDEYDETLAVAMKKIKKRMGKKVATGSDDEDEESAELVRKTTKGIGEVSRRRNEISQGKKPVEIVDESDDGSEEDEMEVDSPVQEDSPKKRAPRRRQANEAELYNIYSGMKFSGTRYPHEETMKRLGIFEDVQRLTEACGLTTFMGYHFEGFKEETCQFLSTLSVHRFVDRPEVEADDGIGFITFSINDNNFTLTLEEIDTLFGFPLGGGEGGGFDKEELQALWILLGNKSKYSSARSKAAQIRHPSIRYFHKVLANTFFARKVSGNVTEHELQFLDIALAPSLYGKRTKWSFRGPSEGVSLSFLLMNQLVNLKAWALKTNTMGVSGELCVGGIVTPILHACGVNIDETDPAGILWIDVPYLTKIRYLHGEKPNDILLYKFVHTRSGESLIRLPCTEYTSLEDGHNVPFDPPRQALYDPHAPPPETQEEERVQVARPERYEFDEESTTLKEANRKVGLLKRWNKWQDKVIRNLKGTVKDLASSVKDMAGQIRELQRKKSSSPQQREEPPLRRSGSFNTIAPRHELNVEPARASSFETRHYTRRMPRTVIPSRFEDGSSADAQLGQTHSVQQTEWTSLGQPHSVQQTELRPLDQATPSYAARVEFPPPNYTKESMDDFLSNFYTKP